MISFLKNLKFDYKRLEHYSKRFLTGRLGLFVFLFWSHFRYAIYCKWFAVYDYRTPSNKFECPNCHTQGKVFKTGQDKEVLKQCLSSTPSS